MMPHRGVLPHDTYQIQWIKRTKSLLNGAKLGDCSGGQRSTHSLSEDALNGGGVQGAYFLLSPFPFSLKSVKEIENFYGVQSTYQNY